MESFREWKRKKDERETKLLAEVRETAGEDTEGGRPDPEIEAHAERLMESFQCATEGCDRASRARGLCRTHYQRWYREQNGATPRAGPEIGPGVQCGVQSCGRGTYARGLCQMHYMREYRKMKRSVDALRELA